MAAVYLGRADSGLGLGQPVAIKVMHPYVADGPDNVRRFVDEARIASRIHHPNVVSLLEAVEADGRVFLVMEYIHGASLGELMTLLRERGETTPVPIAASLVHQALLGLHAAHEATGEDGATLELVHRDISPQNVLVSVSGTAHLTDFGVARAKDRVHATKTGSVVGKATYMAPEQLSGEPLSRRTDLYAMGVVLWELLAGKPLFETEARRLGALAPGWTPPLSSATNPEVPKGVDLVVARLLQRDAARRYATAEAAAAALEAAIRPASPARVAEWVADVAGTRLQQRSTLLAAAQRPAKSAALVVQPESPTESGGGDGPRGAPPAESAGAGGKTPRLLVTAAVLSSLLIAGVAISVRLREPTPAPSREEGPRSGGGGPVDLASARPDSAAPTPSTSGVGASEGRDPAPAPSDAAATRERGRVQGSAAQRRDAAATNCDPPHYFDEEGIKRFRPECLTR